MKPKIELNREYPTRGGGKAIVYRDDGESRYRYLGARTRMENSGMWVEQAWNEAGEAKNPNPFGDKLNIVLPRIVMVPVEVPPDAASVRAAAHSDGDVYIYFFRNEGIGGVPIEDWIASLE